LALAVIAGLLLVRAFIIFHDCTHGSFFASRLANTITGYVTGILAFTPFDEWRHSHGIHHATAGDLDRRGVGDVPTMTVAEYQAAPRRQQIAYRFIRHPLVTFGLGPAWMFLVMARFPSSKIANARDRRSVYLTDLAILAIIIIASLR
jgi:omega-6 fatty acid desaturase (delta-12 desaturase)